MAQVSGDGLDFGGEDLLCIFFAQTETSQAKGCRPGWQSCIRAGRRGQSGRFRPPAGTAGRRRPQGRAPRPPATVAGTVSVVAPRSFGRKLDAHAYVMHNTCMALIQVRDVPEPVRDELARKAAAAGQSMQSYLLGELTRLAERPTMAEIVKRAQARAKASGSSVTMDDAVAEVRAVRDRQES